MLSERTFDPLRKFAQLAAGFMATELAVTFFLVKLECFHSFNLRSQAGKVANSVCHSMAFLHIPMRSSLAGRRVPSDSGRNRTMQRSKCKAAVAPTQFDNSLIY